MEITYRELDYNNASEFKKVAYIHQSTPLEWDSSWKVTDDNVQPWIEKINEGKETKQMFLLLAKADNEIIGFHWIRLYKRDEDQFANIDSLWVDKEHRNKGIAKELKKRGEFWAKTVGAKALTTDVSYKNKTMFELNLKLGFEVETFKMRKNLIS